MDEIRPLDVLFGIKRPPGPPPRESDDDRDLAARARHEARTIGTMWYGFGHGPEGAVCGTCVHLRRRTYVKTYFKCERYGVTRGAATDWRARWRACGLWRARA